MFSPARWFALRFAASYSYAIVSGANLNTFTETVSLRFSL